VLETIKSQNRELREQTIRGLLGGFGFSGDAVDKKVSVLSGGEKVRLAFARLLGNPPNLLLLDEPTTHLDIAARETLEEALQQYEGTLCFVSHDVSFVENIATSIIAMEPPGIARYNGNYDYYREKTEAAGRPQSSNKPQPKQQSGGSQSAPIDKKERRRQRAEARKVIAAESRELRKTVRRAEQQIDIFEKEQAKLVEQLSDSEANIDFAETNRRLQFIQGEIKEYTRRWEQASEELEELDA
jgi:ATP-binding cassette subfamily F protein 3